MASRHVLIMFVLLAGCYRAQRAACTLQCGPGNACPSGQVCQGGWCMANADASCGEASDGSSDGGRDTDDFGQMTDAATDSSDADNSGSDADNDGAEDAPEADAGCGDGGCDFAVGDLPGLVLWLKPGRTVVDSGNHVARWIDSSAYGNDAVQDSPTNRPSASWEVVGGAQAGIARFDVDGMWLQIADDGSMHWGTDDVLFAGVMEDDSAAPPGPAVVFRKQDSVSYPNKGFAVWMSMASPNIGTSSSIGGMIDDQYVLESLGAYNDGRFHIVVFLRTGRRIVVRIDGYEQLTADTLPSDYNITSSELAFIGAHGNGPGDSPKTQQLQGSIAELLIVSGRADNALVSSIEHDLASRHSLSLP